MEGSKQVKRVYLENGRVAHLVDDRVWNSTYTKPALCGQIPNRWFNQDWNGAEDQEEKEKAARLPTCKNCKKRKSGKTK